MTIEFEDTKNLVSELVKINSSNPWLVAGSPGEAQVAEYARRWLENLGLEVRLEEVEPGRPNLIAILRGTGGGKSLCVYAHSDTVGYALWRERALVPRLEGDRLIGLGSADDKGHCAAAMLAVKSLVESKAPLRGDVWVLLAIDEEGTSSGAMDFARRHKPDAMLSLEPTRLGNVLVTHQGFGWLDIITSGRAAHGSAPEMGIDAIVHMGEVIARLGRLAHSKYAPNPHPLNGEIVFHTGTVSGGTDYATYPSRCVLGIEIGTQPGETIDDRVSEIEAIFNEVKQIYPDFQGEVQVRLARNPFNAAGHEDLWEVVAAEVAQETGQPAAAVGENAWGDAALFQEAGIPTLGLGASGGNFHAPEEWVSLGELTGLARIVAGTARKFCA